LDQNLYFTRYLIRYPSDGLNIYGFANIPNEAGAYPVVIALHGYIDPALYNTLDYTTHYAMRWQARDTSSCTQTCAVMRHR